MTSMARPKKQIETLHASADYFEPLFRAALVRVMKQLQKQASINRLALAMHNAGARAEAIPRKQIEDLVRPMIQKIMRDVVRRGGKLGAAHLQELLKHG